MMMKWHKLKDKKPPFGQYIIGKNIKGNSDFYIYYRDDFICCFSKKAAIMQIEKWSNAKMKWHTKKVFYENGKSFKYKNEFK